MSLIDVSDHLNDFSLHSFFTNIEPFACANDGEKNHGDPPSGNLVLGRQTHVSSYSHYRSQGNRPSGTDQQPGFYLSPGGRLVLDVRLPWRWSVGHGGRGIRTGGPEN